MRLIDADKLKAHYAWWGDDEKRKLFDEIVDVQPMVDVQEQKIGHWIEYSRLIIPEPINRYEQAWKCSECGFGNQEDDDSGWIDWNYCPNCGAKMEADYDSV